MKKEILIAILLGLSLGLFITYGLYRSRNATNTEQSKTIENNLTSSPEIEALSTLVLHSPEDESIVSEASITVAGDTEPNNFVVVLINQTETITTADQSGAFSVSGTLEAGSNVIAVYSLDEDGNATTEERVVVYTTKSLTDDADDESTATSSGATSSTTNKTNKITPAKNES
jgi:hypothetical protein